MRAAKRIVDSRSGEVIIEKGHFVDCATFKRVFYALAGDNEAHTITGAFLDDDFEGVLKEVVEEIRAGSIWLSSQVADIEFGLGDSKGPFVVVDHRPLSNKREVFVSATAAWKRFLELEDRDVVPDSD